MVFSSSFSFSFEYVLEFTLSYCHIKVSRGSGDDLLTNRFGYKPNKVLHDCVCHKQMRITELPVYVKRQKQICLFVSSCQIESFKWNMWKQMNEPPVEQSFTLIGSNTVAMGDSLAPPIGLNVVLSVSIRSPWQQTGCRVSGGDYRLIQQTYTHTRAHTHTRSAAAC